MPNIDPKVIFWISIAIAVAGVGSNAALWTGAIPAGSIDMLTAWNHIISVVGQVVMPLLLGQGMTNAGRLANVQSVPLGQKLDSLAANNPEVKSIVTTAALANATDSDKIVSAPPQAVKAAS
jgi:methylaspartate ammonia-lyase